MPTAAELAQNPPDLKKRLMILGLVLVVETIILGGVYLYLASTSKTALAKRNAAEQELLMAMQKSKEIKEDVLNTVIYNTQTKAVEAALDEHIRWSKLFTFLEERTKPTVKYLDLSGDYSAGTASLSATGLSYRDVAEQIVIFREDPLVKSLVTTGASATVDEDDVVKGVSFSLSLTLDKKLWQNTGTSSSVTSSTDATTTVSSSIAPKNEACGISAQPTDAAARCFSSKFTDCSPATITAPNSFGEGTYTITEDSKEGCLVSFVYSPTIKLQQYAGKSFKCTYDSAKDFWGQAGRSLQGCTGDLIDALAPAPAVTNEVISEPTATPEVSPALP